MVTTTRSGQRIPDQPPFTRELDLGDGWRAKLELILQGGRVVVSGVTVFWPGAAIPAGGLTARRLRDLHFTDVTKSDEVLRAAEGLNPARDTLKRYGFRRTVPAGPKRPGRKGHDPIYYVHAATRYAELVAEGKSPIREMAKERHQPPATVAGVITKARRKYGFLTETPPGREGGELTEGARHVLKTYQAGPWKKPRRKGIR